MLTQPPELENLEAIHIDNIGADILSISCRFIEDNYLKFEPELADRVVDKDVIKKAALAINNLVMLYEEISAYDVTADDRKMADEARRVYLTLRKAIELFGSVPKRQTERYLRNRDLPNFLFSAHFNDVLNDAAEQFDRWSSAPTGRRPNFKMDLTTESAVVVVETFLGRNFKKDLRTAPGGFVSLDALFVYQILASLDPAIKQKNVKSALLNLLSSKNLSEN